MSILNPISQDQLNATSIPEEASRHILEPNQRNEQPHQDATTPTSVDRENPTVPAALEESHILREKAKNFRRAMRSYRLAFMDEASKLVSAIPEASYGAFEFSTVSKRLRSFHDVYSTMEHDYEDIEKEIEECDRRLLDQRDEQVKQTVTDGPHLTLPDYDNSSEASEFSFYETDESLLLDWLHALARAESLTQSLKELGARKNTIIDNICEEPSTVDVSPYPTDLISDYDLEYRNKTKQLKDTKRDLIQLRKKMQEEGFAMEDDDLDFDVGVLTGKAPERRSLLLPLQDLMNEAYDKADDFQINRAHHPAARLAEMVNAWLWHILRRSSLQSLYLVVELNDRGITMDQDISSNTVWEYWSQDVLTQRLLQMPSSVYFSQRGSNVLPQIENFTTAITTLQPPDHEISMAPSWSSDEMDSNAEQAIDPFADVDLSTVPIVPQ